MSDVLDKADWLKERATLQRRIKNQRQALKRLNVHITTQLRMLEGYRAREPLICSNCYRHAAVLAEQFWIGGSRIAAYLRKWS